MKKKFAVFLAVFVSFLIGVYFAAEYYVTKKVEEKVERKLKALRPEIDVKYETCKVSLFKKSVSLENVDISGSFFKEPLRIEKITVENIDRKNSFPHYAKISVRNGTIPVVNFPGELRYVMDLLGYQNKISFNSSLDYFFDSEKRDFSLKAFHLDVLDAGVLDVSLKLTEIPDFGNIKGLESLLFKVLSIKLGSGKIIYEDKGFYKRMVNAIARYKHLSPEVVRKKIKSKINREFGNDAVSNMIKNAFLKFVENPERLKVEFHPEKPVSIGTILFNLGTDVMVKELNLRVEAN